eukprot:m.124260 g.124260  ORF g.124260 m.124260 type:complete len:365 (-) comp15589_c0_seq3:246-1340(-)
MEAFYQVVSQLDSDPALIHQPQLAFFRDYLTKHYNATFPASPSPESSTAQEQQGQQEQQEQPQDTEQAEQKPSDEVEGLDLSGVISEEATPTNLAERNLNPTDEDTERGNSLVSEVKGLLKADPAQALRLANEAVAANGTSHRILAARAEALLQCNMPTAAIVDCTAALELNPDSLPALRCRGRAYAKLGKWLQSHKDLSTADGIDFDDSEVACALKHQVKNNVAKIKEHQRHAHEHKSAPSKPSQPQTSQPSSEEPSMPGFPPNMASNPMFAALMQDPELLTALQDPEMMPVIQDLMANPMNFFKYQSNPKVARLMSKVFNKFGGGGFNPAGFNPSQAQAQAQAQTQSQPSSSSQVPPADDLD